jgi:hypothetical protein
VHQQAGVPFTIIISFHAARSPTSILTEENTQLLLQVMVGRHIEGRGNSSLCINLVEPIQLQFSLQWIIIFPEFNLAHTMNSQTQHFPSAPWCSAACLVGLKQEYSKAAAEGGVDEHTLATRTDGVE